MYYLPMKPQVEISLTRRLRIIGIYKVKIRTQNHTSVTEKQKQNIFQVLHWVLVFLGEGHFFVIPSPPNPEFLS